MITKKIFKNKKVTSSGIKSNNFSVVNPTLTNIRIHWQVQGSPRSNFFDFHAIFFKNFAK